MIAIFSVALILIQPVGTFACVPGLEWGMDRSSLEAHLGVPLSERNDSTFEAQSLQIGELPVSRLRLQMGDQGLKHLAYELQPDSMVEVLAGLRSRYGSPVSTTLDDKQQPLQQVWVWNTGDDCITAVRSGNDAFVLSYRPTRLNPALL